MKFILLSILLCLFYLTGCRSSKEQNNSLGGTTMKPNNYTQITAKQAKTMMDEQNDYILLDVRTESEFAEGHIEGAIVIPDTEIANRADSELSDKNALIFVYCRSGRRSQAAASTLAELGYTNIYEFGGIIDWPYDIVK